MNNIPKIRKPIDDLDKNIINELQAELIKKCGESIKNQIVDYSKGNNGRVETLLKDTLLYVTKITTNSNYKFDILPIYTFPIILNKHLTFNMYNKDFKIIASCKIFEKILLYIHDGELSGGKSHEYNIFKKYVTIEKSNKGILHLPHSESNLKNLHGTDTSENVSFLEDDDYKSSFNTVYYNDQLDMDQQSPEFWDSL